ncbi:spore coat U domain-containing protein [Thermodesulfobacteriota bacterium]
MRLINSILILLICLVAFSGPSYADDFDVDVKVEEVNFGDFDSMSHTPIDATGSIKISFKGDDDDEGSGAIFRIKLDAGIYSGGIANFHPRKMSSYNDNTLNYNLYIDAACTKVWGDGTDDTYTHTHTSNDNATIFARIPPRQNVRVGRYSDRVTVTIEW